MRSRTAKILMQYTEVTEFRFGDHGKPSVEGIEFNVSHSGDFALVAVCQQAPVGVDIERIRPDVDVARLLTRLGETSLPSDRTELFERWTRRESMTKAAGGPLFEPPPAGIIAIPLPAPDGYVASLSGLGFEPEYRLRAWPSELRGRQ